MTPTAFSFKRLGLLLRMEWKLEKRNFLFFNLIIALFLIAMIILRYLPEYWHGEDVPSFSDRSYTRNFYVPILITYFFYFLAFMSNRLWQTKGVTFCTIPASHLERYLFLIGVGVIYSAAPSIILWVMTLVEALINPFLLQSGEFFWDVMRFFRWLNEDSLSALSTLGSTMLIASIFFYAMVKQSSPLIACLIFFAIISVIVGVAIAILWGLSEIFPESFSDYPDDGTSGDWAYRNQVLLGQIGTSILWLIDIAFFWASYRSLKRIQLK